MLTHSERQKIRQRLCQELEREFPRTKLASSYLRCSSCLCRIASNSATSSGSSWNSISCWFALMTSRGLDESSQAEFDERSWPDQKPDARALSACRTTKDYQASSLSSVVTYGAPLLDLQDAAPNPCIFQPATSDMSVEQCCQACREKSAAKE